MKVTATASAERGEVLLEFTYRTVVYSISLPKAPAKKLAKAILKAVESLP